MAEETCHGPPYGEGGAATPETKQKWRRQYSDTVTAAAAKAHFDCLEHITMLSSRLLSIIHPSIGVDNSFPRPISFSQSVNTDPICKQTLGFVLLHHHRRAEECVRHILMNNSNNMPEQATAGKQVDINCPRRQIIAPAPWTAAKLGYIGRMRIQEMG